jgi:hypothetical protein
MTDIAMMVAEDVKSKLEVWRCGVVGFSWYDMGKPVGYTR